MRIGYCQFSHCFLKLNLEFVRTPTTHNSLRHINTLRCIPDSLKLMFNGCYTMGVKSACLGAIVFFHNLSTQEPSKESFMMPAVTNRKDTANFLYHKLSTAVVSCPASQYSVSTLVYWPFTLICNPQQTRARQTKSCRGGNFVRGRLATAVPTSFLLTYRC